MKKKIIILFYKIFRNDLMGRAPKAVDKITDVGEV